ncbi:uncharacterized protein LOC127802130 [Diospyros lotus]|uniref:uncharacterized protein LOC127802130 n=1 Tax=Diospyros lotus TaxID=55363 RepID=UPI0022506868|nr:uncharacterized protein LOC127802130 [Diospyros lotus]
MSNNIRMFFRMIHEEVEDDEEDEAIVTALVKQYAQHMDHDSFSHPDGFMLNHRVINRNKTEGYDRLYHDYFADSPTYPSQLFCRRFHMHQSLFLRIQAAIETHDQYFVQIFDAVEVPGLSSLQKMIAVLRMLTYGSPADVVDEYARIDEVQQ